MTCHPESLAGEFAALADTLLERLTPLLEAEPTPASCANCPVCAVLALLRGERPELAVTLANHAAGVLAALRALMETWPEGPAHDGTTGRAAGPEGTNGHGGTHGAGRRRVQRIPVTRV